MVGDCLEVLRDHVPDECVDLIVTSPPYADLRPECSIRPDDYVDWFTPRAEQFLRVLKPTGSFILNICDRVVDGERHLFVFDLVIALKRQLGFVFVETHYWMKRNPMPGSFRKRAMPAVEPIFWFARTKSHYWSDEGIRQPYRSKRHLGKPKSRLRAPNQSERDLYRRGSALPPNYFTWTKEGKRDGADFHTAVFPIRLPTWFIKAGCPAGGTVMDPFAGSGTTAIAAQVLGRDWVLIEQDPAYADVICQRLGTEAFVKAPPGRVVR
jgi:DNA modification methylase